MVCHLPNISLTNSFKNGRSGPKSCWSVYICQPSVQCLVFKPPLYAYYFYLYSRYKKQAKKPFFNGVWLILFFRSISSKQSICEWIQSSFIRSGLLVRKWRQSKSIYFKFFHLLRSVVYLNCICYSAITGKPNV